MEKQIAFIVNIRDQLMYVGWNSLDVINNTNFARKMEKDADWNK